MWTKKTLDLRGHNGRRIHSCLNALDPPARVLTVIVAGFGYTAESPYLYYSRQVPLRHGSDVLAVDFEYSRNAKFLGLPEGEQEAWFQEEISTLAAYLAKEDRYGELNFIGKSLGTTTIYGLLRDGAIRARTRRLVWLTPGERRREIEALMLSGEFTSFAVYGLQDPLAENTDFGKLKESKAVRLLLLAEAGHALDADHPGTSVEYLRKYLEELESYWLSVR